MSTLETKKIEPLSGTSVTLGAAGDAVTMPAGVTVKTNTVKDAGGNTLWTSDGSGTLSSVNSALQGNMIFISSQTASSSASLEFTTGIDSTYDEYVFYFVNVQPATDGRQFQFQANASGETGYNETMTTTWFGSKHTENNNTAALTYQVYHDQANDTGAQYLSVAVGSASDESTCGELHLYSPSSTTYAKHFVSTFNTCDADVRTYHAFISGYFNTTTAITQLKFWFDSGNIAAGTIYLYGIK